MRPVPSRVTCLKPTAGRLHVKILDAALQVYQVQEQVLPRPSSEHTAAADADLQFNIVQHPFSFSVVRKSTNETLFDTAGQAIIFESQYVRLQTALPDDPNLYGLGEHSDSFRLPTTGYQRVLYNVDSAFIPRNSNLYGSHPVYFDHRGDRGTHGVFLLNSDPMNINISNAGQPGTQHLEYNTVGGVLDFYFLAGPKPADVSKQYAEVVGFPAMHMYWTFGFHQCKYGYWDVNMVAEVVANYSAANIPLETMWTDIDYMDLRQDFTLNPQRFPLHKMQELVQTLHARGQHYVLILDPGIHPVSDSSAYQRGEQQGVFLQTAAQTDYQGVQWSGVVVWPDWFAPSTGGWWTNEFKQFFDPNAGVDIDAIWIDMDEPSNFCPNVTCDPPAEAAEDDAPPAPAHPPRPNTGRPIPGFPADFQPNGTAPAVSRRTGLRRDAGDMKGLAGRDLLAPKYRINNYRGDLSASIVYTNVTNHDGTAQYDTHNLYGNMVASASYDAMLARRPAQRPFVLTRSTFAGAGTRAAHWFGDNASQWADYRVSIAQMLAFVAVHQVPMVGSDVCGFNDAPTEHMCARWAMLGAFYPFYRQHSDIATPQKEFYQWNLTALAAQKAIATRYQLLDYMYTALHAQSTAGTPMVRPLFYQYPADPRTFGIETQFFFGDALLVSPVVDDDAQSVTLYVPDDVFYDYWTGATVRGPALLTLNNVGYTDIPVHVRGGTIVPLRSQSANTTAALRRCNFTLLVAPGVDGTAAGALYLDDGESVHQDAVSLLQWHWDGSALATSGTFDFAGKDAAEKAVVVDKVVIMGQMRARGNGAFSAAKQTLTVPGPWPLNADLKFSLAG